MRITGHQACLTREALTNITDTTVTSLNTWASGDTAEHAL